jgi:antitoxin (DNA-binding transcriptional repressor) of toxin-antitoxin stability system
LWRRFSGSVNFSARHQPSFRTIPIRINAIPKSLFFGHLDHLPE